MQRACPFTWRDATTGPHPGGGPVVCENIWPSEVPDPVVRAVPDVTDHVVQTAVAYMSDRAAAGDVTDHVVQTAAAHLTDRDAAADVPERVIGTTVSDVPDHVVHTAVADVSGHCFGCAQAGHGYR